MSVLCRSRWRTSVSGFPVEAATLSSKTVSGVTGFSEEARFVAIFREVIGFSHSPGGVNDNGGKNMGSRIDADLKQKGN